MESLDRSRDVVVLGAPGNIGSATFKMLTTQQKHTVLGLVDSGGAVFGKAEINQAQESIKRLDLSDADKSRASIREVMQGAARVGLKSSELLQALKDHGISEETVIIDATSSDNYDLHKAALEDGYSVVTAAKGQIVNHTMAEYKALVEHRDRYGYEATIMAGRGAIDLLRQQREIGDEVTNIQLVSSGSIGGTLQALSNGKLMDEACRNNDASFEPEPYLDLSGKDLGGKLLTALRELGLNYELSDIEPHIKGLVDSKYEGLTKSDFYNRVAEENQRFAEIMADANAKGQKPVYVASFNVDKQGIATVSVKMELLDASSVMGALKGSENIIRITTKGIQAAGDGPDRLIGAGAGRYATAKGLVNDIRNV